MNKPKDKLTKPEHLEMIRRLWFDENLSDERIAWRFEDDLGITVGKNAIMRVRRGMGITGRGAPIRGKRAGIGAMRQLDEEEQRKLREWNAAGYSDHAIANRFWRDSRKDYSETFIQRQRVLIGLAAPGKRLKAVKRAKASGPKLGRLSKTVLCPPRAAIAASGKMHLFDVPEGTQPVPLLKMKPGMCLWPYDGKDGEVVYCGAPQTTDANGRDHSYCKFHYSQAVNSIWSPLRRFQKKAAPMGDKIKIGEEVA